MLSVLLYNILSIQIVYRVQLNCTDSNYRDTNWLLFSSGYSTKYFLHKYCTKCTVCNWTVLTVITQNLLLHVQLHNSTAHLFYKYCTNSTFCNGTVLTVITQKLLLHVQLHNNTAYLWYKYCTICTLCIWTVLTVITQKLLLHDQLHNSTAYLLYKYVQTLQSANEMYLQ